MGVMRLGFVHLRVTDLEEARNHYSNTLGMTVVAEQPGKLYLKCWDEWDHHSLVLEEGGVGLVKLGYKCQSAADLERFEQRSQRFGATTSRVHTAVKISPHYEGPVVYVPDASRSVSVSSAGRAR